MTQIEPKLVKRFLARCQPDPHSECILWQGAKTRGYGRLRFPGLNRSGWTRAHRVAIWLFRGIHPGSNDVDHACGVRHCVNPYHLRCRDHTEHGRKAMEEFYARPDDFDPDFIF